MQYTYNMYPYIALIKHQSQIIIYQIIHIAVKWLQYCQYSLQNQLNPSIKDNF